ncbi:YheU family protein [Alteromonas sp. 14N.309.X.WAT.G.H12]|uniref:YheU family protein n=1 Tax=Alteromonas sp. 14N.309.X.WAT.G.H12 TaxID=3120824 RepID=UPI002FD35909
MIIPIEELDKETLTNIAESFVLREGTDYGEIEASFEDKVNQVLRSLQKGDTVLVYSELHESVNIQDKREYDASEQ